MKKLNFELTSFHLHILAMALMLCDHLWVSVVPGNDWLTDIGRIAFPIFAFMTAEGFHHTKNIKKYAGRLLLFAVISEVPFNLVAGGSVFYPLHQNVLWTFLISVGLMWINEKAKDRKLSKRILIAAITVGMGFILGILSFCDYHYSGIFTVLVFYFLRERNWRNFVIQLIFLWYINVEMLSGFYYEWELFGTKIEVVRQGFAMFALVPIWLYNGKQGLYNKAVRNLYYWFYPAHLLVLWLLRQIIA